jgi:sulfonate dioxygenase
VTLLKSLNYNPSFIERIEELNRQESHHLLAFLREHLLNASDLTVRWKWTPGAVAFWDNRIVVHRAVPGGIRCFFAGRETHSCLWREALF